MLSLECAQRTKRRCYSKSTDSTFTAASYSSDSNVGGLCGACTLSRLGAGRLGAISLMGSMEFGDGGPNTQSLSQEVHASMKNTAKSALPPSLTLPEKSALWLTHIMLGFGCWPFSSDVQKYIF